MRICDNIHAVSDIFIPNYNILNQSLNQENLSLKGIKLAVPNTQVIDMNTQPKGVYFLEITTSTGGINKKVALQ